MHKCVKTLVHYDFRLSRLCIYMYYLVFLMTSFIVVKAVPLRVF